jgi:hypothetical protein
MTLIVRSAPQGRIRMLSEGLPGTPAGLLDTPHGMAYLLRAMAIFANFDSLVLADA